MSFGLLSFRDLMEELVVYIREAIDKKQENMRRRRRRDALRLQLVRVLEKIAEKGTFGVRYVENINQNIFFCKLWYSNISF